MKRILALSLCLVLLAGSVLWLLTSCASSSNNTSDKGAYITMYLNSEMYDFDPANAYYNNDVANILELIYEPLFTLNEKGKVKPALATKYKTFSDDEGFHMEISIKSATWSNQFPLTAKDVRYAWLRLLAPQNHYEAAALLFDIKNARAYNQGTMSQEDVMIEEVEAQVLRITFEGVIDTDAFLVNLTSVATAPLLSQYIRDNDDWAKKASTINTNGPFTVSKVRYYETDETAMDDNAVKSDGTTKSGNSKVQKIQYFILDRNPYYDRDLEHDKLDKYVKPYRILVDCTMSAETMMEEYQNGYLFSIGSIPLSLRNDSYVQNNVKISDSLSTFTLYLNENAEIGGTKLFANQSVRRALSLAIDREEIAKEAVYAEPATGLVAPGVFETATAGSFRQAGGNLIGYTDSLIGTASPLANPSQLIGTTQNLDLAKQLLSSAGINPAAYSFSISVASYDEVQIRMVEMIAGYWGQLGFRVSVLPLQTIQNNDFRDEDKDGKDDNTTDVCDDLYTEAIQRGKFEVIALDTCATVAGAYSVLSGFAVGFSGSNEVDEYDPHNHVTGYNSSAYNDLMEAIYFLPYFSGFEADPSETIFEKEETNRYLGFGFESKTAYQAIYERIKAVYESYGIVPDGNVTNQTKQKAFLLHKAEELLMNEMPVIPVVFNQNAVLINTKYLSGVTAKYYAPSDFRKTKMKKYKNYTYVFYKFPNIYKDNYGLTEEPKTSN